MSWNLQKLTGNGRTAGTASVHLPCVSVYGKQQHVAYRDKNGTIWDAWYDPSNNNWNLQQINNKGNTDGPPAVEGPFVGVYQNQQHFLYIDARGNLLDSFFDGSNWRFQQINAGGATEGPPAKTGGWANLVSVWTDYTGTQQHFTYTGTDLSIYDAFYDGNSWHLQKINSGGNTTGPSATSSPFGCVFHKQQHILYQGANGEIMDSWYDGFGHWTLQTINIGGMTAGPAAFNNTCPRAWVDYTNTQMHVTY